MSPEKWAEVVAAWNAAVSMPPCPGYEWGNLTAEQLRVFGVASDVVMSDHGFCTDGMDGEEQQMFFEMVYTHAAVKGDAAIRQAVGPALDHIAECGDWLDVLSQCRFEAALIAAGIDPEELMDLDWPAPPKERI